PKGEQVSDLFELLRQLVGHYITCYMAQQGNLLSFTATKENPAEFSAIAAQFPVSRYPYRHVVMKEQPDSLAFLFLDWADIKHILDDPMRPEFANYGQIVLVPYPDVTKSTLQIAPVMHRNYKIVLNDKETPYTISDPNRPINISLPATPKLESASASFTLNQVRNGSHEGASVVIDDYNQTVFITLHQRPIEVIKPHFEGPKPSKRWALYSILGGIGLLALLFALYFFVLRNNTPSEEPAPPQNTELIENQQFEDKINDELGDNAAVDNLDNRDNADTEVIDKNNPKENASETVKSDKPVKSDNPAKSGPTENTDPNALGASEQFNRWKNQLSGTNFSENDFDAIKRGIESSGLSAAQKKEINDLIADHESVFAICANADGADKKKAALLNLKLKGAGLKAYINTLVKDEDFDIKATKIGQTRSYK
ncbi:MAG: hypothetical protein K2G64_07430, partial [Muribaculaceae bacterium]|nr:hypothetical protein [Muribaculaceae bacterium]